MVAAVASVIFLSSLVLIPNVCSQLNNSVIVLNNNIIVLSHNWYIRPSDSDFIVVGEVQNIGKNVLQSVILNATAYDSNKDALAGSSTMAYVNYLLPQQKAPFYFDFQQSNLTDNSWASSVSSVNFVVFNATSTIDREYNLTLHTGFNGVDNGAYVVTGSVFNSGDQTANDIRVVGTYYNSAGSVIAVGFDIVNGALSPNNATGFIVSEFDVTSSLLAQISNYSLLVQTSTLQNSASPSPSASSSALPTSSGSSWLIYAVVGTAVIILVAVTALAFLRKRRNLPPPPPPPPPPSGSQEEYEASDYSMKLGMPNSGT